MESVAVGEQPAGPRVLTVGSTYRDLVLLGVAELPRAGEESYASSLFETWGGIANVTRLCARLGLPTALCTALGDDDASDRLVAEMAAQGVDTSLSRRHAGWRLPVTVALTLPHDRAMITVEEPPPADLSGHLDPDQLGADAVVVDLRDAPPVWLAQIRERGARVYASRGFDATGEWDLHALAEGRPYDVWMLNESEATAFTGQSDALAAARTLARQAPLVIVTRGADGIVAVDSARGEEASVPAFAVRPRSFTGAGDVTLAAFVVADGVPGLSLAQRLDVAAFVAAVTIAQPGGPATPPSRTRLLAELDARRDDPRHAHLHAALAPRIRRDR